MLIINNKMKEIAKEWILDFDQAQKSTGGFDEKEDDIENVLRKVIKQKVITDEEKEILLQYSMVTAKMSPLADIRNEAEKMLTLIQG